MTDMICEICGVKVTSWSARYEADTVHCKKCFDTPESKELIDKKHVDTLTVHIQNEKNLQSEKNRDKYSSLSVLLFILSALSLLVGVLMFGKLFPETSKYSQAPSTFAYIPSLIWITAGLAQFALFAFCGQVLHYIKLIHTNLKSNEH